jgi:hypothetical protein
MKTNYKGLGKTHWAVIKIMSDEPFLTYRIGDCTIYDRLTGKFNLTVVAPRSTIAQEFKL